MKSSQHFDAAGNEFWTFDGSGSYTKPTAKDLYWFDESLGKNVCEFGILHRKDGPALITYNESVHVWVPDGIFRSAFVKTETAPVIKRWFVDGFKHRTDGPAWEAEAIGHYQWFINNKRHRLDGPANITPEVSEWYQDGKLHRVDGPAVVSATHEIWYSRRVVHRLDGPAFINKVTKRNRYYAFGQACTKQQMLDRAAEAPVPMTTEDIMMKLGHKFFIV